MSKVHYLKGARPSSPAPSSNYEELIHRLEGRIDQIQKEFRDTVRQIEKTEELRHEIEPTEFASLIHKLEGRIQNISDEIRTGRGEKESETLRRLQQGLEKFRDLISFEGFKDFLSALWFGHPEETYDVDEFGMDPTFSKKVKPFFDFLYNDYWRVAVKGLGNIPSEGRGLIVSNHSGTLPYDGAMIRLSVENDHPSRRDVRFLVEDFVYHFPFLGTFMYRTGGVRACQEHAERLLSKNHLVAVFPEGVKGIGKHYKNRYRLERFGRGGFIKLALRTNTPIIPTAVIGAEEIHPILYKSTVLARPLGIPYLPVTPTLPLLGPLGFIPLPSKWTIIFGEPFYFNKQYDASRAEDQLLVNRLSETVRMKVQEMVVEALKNRRSIWFG